MITQQSEVLRQSHLPNFVEQISNSINRNFKENLTELLADLNAGVKFGVDLKKKKYI
jgi:hypothetical protein